MTALIAFLITLLVSIGAILFNAYFLQVIYDLALIPIFNLFEIQLPQMTYGMFILVWILYILIAEKFITKSKNKVTYNANNTDEVITYLGRVFVEFINIILKKSFYLLIVYLTYKIFFV